MMEHPLEHCVASVWKYKRESASGTAFLITDDILCTCTHVVQSSSGAVLKAVWLEFPFLKAAKLRAEVIHHVPVNEVAGDVAFLKLSEIPPDSLPIRMLPTRGAAGTPCQIYGFPRGFERGLYATVVLGDKNGYGWRDLVSEIAHGIAVDSGFSGAPVWDTIRQGIIGMVVAKHKSRLVSFCIPSETITVHAPESPPSGWFSPNDFDKIMSDVYVRGSLRSQRADLISDYLYSILVNQPDPEQRYWICVTIGRIGGPHALRYIHQWSKLEQDHFALQGVSEARALLEA